MILLIFHWFSMVFLQNHNIQNSPLTQAGAKAETHGIRLGSLLCLTTRKVITEKHPKHWTGIKHWVIQDSQGWQGWLMKTWRNNDNTNEIWENPTEKNSASILRHSFRPNAYWLAQLECLKMMPLSCTGGEIRSPPNWPNFEASPSVYVHHRSPSNLESNES